MMVDKLSLGAVDYAIIGITLVISGGIGLFFRVFGGQQKTNDEYLFAGKNMPIFPVAFSLMATFMAATTLMGIPAEMYLYGTHMAFMNVGFILGTIISSYLFIPIYFDNNVSTAYEYLERRFGKTTRRVLCGIFLIQTILFSGVALYAPALALSVVTNLSVWTSVIAVGIVCTFYCTLGGMKAVLWTDVFQASLMYICLLSIVIKGCLDLGGIGGIFRTAYDGGRIVLPTFDLNFSTRYTMYSVFLQGLIITIFAYGNSQEQVQRQLTVKNVKSSTVAALLSVPMLVAFHLLCCLCGLIFYAYYKECDPMTSPLKSIHSADQLMPLYITSTMSQYPGFAGLCIAGIFSASLSTLSSAINSMAAVTYKDIIKSIWPTLSESVSIPKIASVFYGILTVFITYMVSSMGNLVKATVLVIGMVSGPGLGVFLLAALTTTATETGVNLGVIAGFVSASCMILIPTERYYKQLEVGKNCSVEEENWLNSTLSFNNEESVNASRSSSSNEISTNHDLEDNFPISFMWITPISLVICVIVGYFGSWIISYFTGKQENVPDCMLSPLRRRFLPKQLSKENKSIENYEAITQF